ncbi:MAG: O-antigen ligase family protein [Frankiaceae bacterium]|nr:O-antigen ligase family protein [Frankiaceae bacterium]
MAALLALVLSALLFATFLHLERTGRQLQVVLWLLALLVVESGLWPDPNTIPAGLVHPSIGGSNFRLLDTVVLAAIAAHLLVRGIPNRLRATDACWLLFFGWMLTAAVVGVLVQNDRVLLVYEAKAFAYLGVMWVASGVPAHQWRGPALPRFLIIVGAGVAVLLLVDQSGLARPINLPLLSSPNAGRIGSDAATVFGTLGVLACVRALHESRRRFLLLAASVPLLLSALAAGQRAAMIGTGCAVLFCVVVLAITRQHVRVPLGELVVIGLLAGALVAAPVLLGALGGKAPSVPLTTTVEQALHSRGKQLSSQGRVNQWREVRPLLAERLVQGHGLGKTYAYYEPGPAEFVVSDVTHNVVLDVLLRMGLVGVLLFLAAVTSTVVDGLRVVRRSLEPLVSATALAATAGVVGWAAKGMVESLFEKYRLALLLGLLVGMVCSLSRSHDPSSDPEDDWDASLMAIGHQPTPAAGAAT